MARFEGGWFKIYRKMLKLDRQANDFFGDGHCALIWIYLIGWANVQDSKCKFGGKQITLTRGQLLTSVAELTKATGFGRQTIRRCLAYLEKNEKINQQTNQHGTLVTVINYETYQSKEESPNQPTNQRPTNDQPLMEEVKNKRPKEPPPPPPSEPVGEVLHFDNFLSREVIEYAERKFNCVFDSRQISKFRETWADNPRFTAADIKRALDWIASHPKARADTIAPLQRCFSLMAVQADARNFDKNVKTAIRDLRQAGCNDDEIVQKLSESQDYDQRVMEKYVRSKL